MPDWVWILVLALVAVALLAATLTTAFALGRLAGSGERTDEKARWRKEIRRNAADAVRLLQRGEADGLDFRLVVTNLRLRLDPSDPFDQAILLCLEDIAASGDPGARERLEHEFVEMVAGLLKTDWERSTRAGRFAGRRGATSTRELRSFSWRHLPESYADRAVDRARTRRPRMNASWRSALARAGQDTAR